MTAHLLVQYGNDVDLVVLDLAVGGLAGWREVAGRAEPEASEGRARR